MEEDRKIRWSVLSFGLLFSMIFCLCFYVYIQTKAVSEFGKSIEHSIVIAFDEINDSIFINAKRWGITGDHACITLTDSKNNKQKTINRSYIYYERQGDDSLFIYYPSSYYQKDSIFFLNMDNIVIKIVEYKKNESELYDEKYSNNKLLRVAINDLE